VAAEGLVPFALLVADHRDGERLVALAGLEDERGALGEVVGGRPRGPVPRGGVRLDGRLGEADSETVKRDFLLPRWPSWMRALRIDSAGTAPGLSS
jgi:hypothetical protein